MADRTWKSVMMKNDAHALLVELSEYTKKSMAELLESMVRHEWERKLGAGPTDNPFLNVPPPGIKTYKSRV
jgi:hypothetical protein